MKKKSPTPDKKPRQSNKSAHSTTTSAQRARLLAALRLGPVSTIKARHDLDIIAPAPRIHELRHNAGHKILTVWRTETTPEGFSHRVAEYVLQSQGGGV
jgi:hypothetical protein